MVTENKTASVFACIHHLITRKNILEISSEKNMETNRESKGFGTEN